MNNSKLSRSILIYENKHTLRSEYIILARTCANGVSSGLATEVTFTSVTEKIVGLVQGGWACLWFNCCTVVCDCCVAF
jgi:hypothetical protein